MTIVEYSHLDKIKRIEKPLVYFLFVKILFEMEREETVTSDDGFAEDINENLVNFDRLHVFDPLSEYGIDQLDEHRPLSNDDEDDDDDHSLSQVNGNRFNELIYKYDIQKIYAEYLYLLEEYEIIIVCDDSGSMTTEIENTNLTRWDLLSFIVKIVADISIVFDENGIDIYFLNRPEHLNVKDVESIDRMFSKRPRGYTPLKRVLQHIFQLPSTRRGNDKKTLVFIATDGQPTDEKGNVNIEEIEDLMNNQRNAQTTHVMFLICTDDREQVKYLSKWDELMTNVDITQDYHSEKAEVERCRGKEYPFSLGDYICKAILGAVHPFFDGLNEEKPLLHITKH